MTENGKRKTRTRWKVLVVWKNGDEEFVAQGDHDAVFPNKKAAEENAAMLRMGIEGAQSVSVVRA